MASLITMRGRESTQLENTYSMSVKMQWLFKCLSEAKRTFTYLRMVEFLVISKNFLLKSTITLKQFPLLKYHHSFQPQLNRNSPLNFNFLRLFYEQFCFWAARLLFALAFSFFKAPFMMVHLLRESHQKRRENKVILKQFRKS